MSPKTNQRSDRGGGWVGRGWGWGGGWVRRGGGGIIKLSAAPTSPHESNEATSHDESYDAVQGCAVSHDKGVDALPGSAASSGRSMLVKLSYAGPPGVQMRATMAHNRRPQSSRAAAPPFLIGARAARAPPSVCKQD